MEEDNQSKRVRGNSFQTRRLVSGPLRLLSFKSSPPSLRPLHVAALVAVVLYSSLSCFRMLSCWGAFGEPPESCARAPPELRAAEREPGGVGDIKPFFIPRQAPWNDTNPFKKRLPDDLRRTLKDTSSAEAVPVVVFYARPGALPCGRNHYIYRNLRQARKLNDLVYFIGPKECADMAGELGVVLEPYGAYQDVIDWFERHLGRPIGYQVRWFVLRVFMERHSFPRLFYADSDVMLFANVTEMAHMLFPASPLVLSVRWPSLRPPVGPTQYASTSVSGHVALWTYDALVDFLKFFVVFVQRATLFGTPGDKGLVEQKAYNDMVVLGWYTFKICWVRDPKNLHPQCIADKASGVTPQRSARIRAKYAPKFQVETFCAPRWCNATSWVDEGWCVFDNNFSVQNPTQYFRYRPDEGMKCPTSMRYSYFEDWQKSEKQTSPVQFMGVHFQAHKKGFLTRGDEPSRTWGSSSD